MQLSRVCGIRWLGESNGYYSERVPFELEKARTDRYIIYLIKENDIHSFKFIGIDVHCKIVVQDLENDYIFTFDAKELCMRKVVMEAFKNEY